jgi:hypothetical protein
MADENTFQPSVPCFGTRQTAEAMCARRHHETPPTAETDFQDIWIPFGRGRPIRLVSYADVRALLTVREIAVDRAVLYGLDWPPKW